MTILFNHQLIDRSQAQVDIEDRGYQFGDGVYEVIRVYEGKTFCLPEHVERLQRSAREIGITLPYDEQRMEELLLQLLHANRIHNGTIYLQVSRGVAPRSHPFPKKSEAIVVAYTNEAERPYSSLNNGIRAVITEDIRWLRCDIKSLNLLGSVLAKQYATENGCEEAILHRDGRVTEGSSTNVFRIKDGTLYTHPANNLILHGINRAVTLELAQELQIPVKEESFTTDALFQADEIFVTSTTMEISPVITVNGRKVGDGKPGKVTRQLQHAFEKRI